MRMERIELTPSKLTPGENEKGENQADSWKTLTSSHWSRRRWRRLVAGRKLGRRRCEMRREKGERKEFPQFGNFDWNRKRSDRIEGVYLFGPNDLNNFGLKCGCVLDQGK